MRAYRLAVELVRVAWKDTAILRRHPVTEAIVRQLYRAIASVAANIGEGYSRSSGRDRARIFEFALGSSREAGVWYHAATPILSPESAADRLGKLAEIQRLLIAAIQRERVRVIRPQSRRAEGQPVRGGAELDKP